MSVAFIILFCFSLSACNFNSGKTDEVVIDTGNSTTFSKEEIQAAMDCVIEKFKDFKGCNLTKLWYDEYRSNEEIEFEMDAEGFRESVKGKQVIILFSDFSTDSTAAEGFGKYSTYCWEWILVRNNKAGKWKVSSSGDSA